MDIMKSGWFSELNDLWPGVALSLKVEEILHAERTKFQDLLIVKTKSHGRALMLDGVIQCTEKDEMSYHEMIAYLALCNHPKPRKVLIIGGGDGGAIREVAKHPDVESITLVEIDIRVIEVCKQYMPSLSLKGLNDPKLKICVGDGFKFLEDHHSEYDVIITDSSDPVGPAENLFKRPYYELLKNALKSDGIIISQAGTAWMNMDQVYNTLQHCKAVFTFTAYATTAVPTYPTGQIGFVLGSLTKNNLSEPLRVFSDEELDHMEMKYYNDKVHQAAFVLPRFVEKGLHEKLKHC